MYRFTLKTILTLFLAAPVLAQWTEPVRIMDDPAMNARVIAVGETLHVVVETSVWTTYLRSPDNGDTWTDPVVPADTFYGGSQMPDIAYSNGLLHISYVGRLEGEARSQIFVLSSSDGGRTWTRRRQVFYNISYGLKTPRMAVNGDTLFLSCRSENISVFRTLDNGEIWDDSVMVESGTLAIIQAQNIEFSTSVLHLIMPYGILNNSTGIEVYYRKSTDYGLNWSDRVALSTEELYPDIRDSQSPSSASDVDGNLIAAWFDYKYGSACGFSGDILGRITRTNGNNWLQETRLTYTQTGGRSGSAIFNGIIHMAWEDEYPNGCGYAKIMYSESRDWGQSWAEPEIITGPADATEYSPAFVYSYASGDTILHCFFGRDFPGEGIHTFYTKRLNSTAIQEPLQNEHRPMNINLAAYPNPFNTSLVLNFMNPEEDDLKIEIYNVLGQIVRSFNFKQAKEGKVDWNATDDSGQEVSSGVYLIRAITGQTEEMISVVYIR